MAILAFVTHPGFKREHYDALRTRVNWEKDYPAGAILHACSFDEQGGLRVADLWESAEQMENFFTGKLLPELEKLNLTPPKVEMFPAYNVDAFPAATNLLLQAGRAQSA